MKKLMILSALILLPLALIAQTIEPPAGWEDVILNPGKWFVDFGAFAILTAFVAAFLNGVLKVTKSFVKQLVAWLTAIVILVASSLLNFGYAAEFPIVLVIIHGFAAGLAANGIFDIPLINQILNAVEGWFIKDKEK